MRHRFGILACTLLLALPCALAANRAANARELPAAATGGTIPDALQPAVSRAEFLGRQLYFHDRAAWLATDAMFADPRMEAHRSALGGWLTEPSARGIRVIFISGDETPRRLYEIEVDEAEHVYEATLEPPAPLTAEHLVQLKARNLVRSQTFMRCAEQYNMVVMPSSQGVRVYLMPGFTRHGVYPVGGYHLYEVDNTGERILTSRKFSNGCLDLDESAAMQDDSVEAVRLMATHLLDPQPTEVHAFVSLYAKLPLTIITTTNKRVWSVDKGTIAFTESID